MDFYFKKRRWKIFLLLLAVVIGIVSFFYTNWLVKNMAKEERKNVELWAEATRKLANSDINSNQDNTSFLLEIINRNTTIPIIITDSLDQIGINRNISYSDDNMEKVLKRELRKMKEENDPIIVSL
ncbi:MAG TPA: ATP-binding protein, partial [Prolixibacteraceae bacterium]